MARYFRFVQEEGDPLVKDLEALEAGLAGSAGSNAKRQSDAGREIQNRLTATSLDLSRAGSR